MIANLGFQLEHIMHARHTVSLTSFDNADDWIMTTNDQLTDPLDILIRAELEHDADLAGFDSVDDYLHANPSILFN